MAPTGDRASIPPGISIAHTGPGAGTATAPIAPGAGVIGRIARGVWASADGAGATADGAGVMADGAAAGVTADGGERVSPRHVSRARVTRSGSGRSTRSR